MVYQLAKVLQESSIAADKMREVYQALECQMRHSIMAPHLTAKYPDIFALTVGDLVFKGSLGPGRTVTVNKPGHPLHTLTYIAYSKFADPSDATYRGIVGYFSDPNETVLKYVRKDLF